MLPDVRNVLAKMYTDRMTVRRYPEGVTDEDGAIVSTLEPAPVPGLEEICCRISFGSKDSPVISDDKNPVDVQPTLICDPDVPLKSGDYITVTRGGKDVYSGNIGRPNRYGSSLQVLFRDIGNS